MRTGKTRTGDGARIVVSDFRAILQCKPSFRSFSAFWYRLRALFLVFNFLKGRYEAETVVVPSFSKTSFANGVIMA